MKLLTKENMKKVLGSGYSIAKTESRFNWVKFRFEHRTLAKDMLQADFEPISDWMPSNKYWPHFNQLRNDRLILFAES